MSERQLKKILGFIFSGDNVEIFDAGTLKV